MIRSEDMNLILFYFNKDTAKQAVVLLGNEKIVQFLDLQQSKKSEILLFSKNVRDVEKVFSRLSFLDMETKEIDSKSDVDSNKNKNDISAESRSSVGREENAINRSYEELEGYTSFDNANNNNDTKNNNMNNYDGNSNNVKDNINEEKNFNSNEYTYTIDTNTNDYTDANADNSENTSTTNSSDTNFDDVQKDIKRHYERLIYLKEIKKETLSKIKTITEDLHVTEQLDFYLSYNISPDFLDECKHNLDFVCFSVDQEKGSIVEKILSNMLRRNIIMYKTNQILDYVENNERSYDNKNSDSKNEGNLDSLNDDNNKTPESNTNFVDSDNNTTDFNNSFNSADKKKLSKILSNLSLGRTTIFIIFTHGTNATTKIKHISSSLGARIIDDFVIKKGTLEITSLLNQVYKIYCSNEKTLEIERIAIKNKISHWKSVVYKELRVYQTLNSLLFLNGVECLVGQAFVRSCEMKKLKRLIAFINRKFGYVSMELMKKYRKCDAQVNDNNENNDDCISENDNVVDSVNMEVCTTNNNDNVLDSVNMEVCTKNNNDNVLDSVNMEVCTKHNNDNVLDSVNMEVCTKHNNDNVVGCVNMELCTKNNNDNDVKNSPFLEKNTGINPFNNKDDDDNIVTDNLGTNSNQNSPVFNQNISSTKKFNGFTVDVPARTLSTLQTPKQPPTYFKTTKFTKAFQDVCNVYGVPSFKEINPAIVYITTFPFMFGAMFGDVFHGLILLFISLYIIKKEKTIKVPECCKLLYEGRYIMLLCSLWAIFFGFIYNDFASLTINIFPSKYGSSSTNTGNNSYTYPIGIDPAWHHSEKNGMAFSNSTKMKLSIIIGFFHMLIGIVMAYLNSIYTKDITQIYCVIIPQTISYLAFVGYLTFLIYYKWILGGDYSIISIFVNMFTTPNKLEQEVFKFQGGLQRFLVCCLVVSMPWMLFGKPMFETLKWMRCRKRKNPVMYLKGINSNSSSSGSKILEGYTEKKLDDAAYNTVDNKKEILQRSSDDDNNTVANTNLNINKATNTSSTIINSNTLTKSIATDNSREKQKIRNNLKIEQENPTTGLVDIWMHQGIETIEFGIGLISNTSSYLRLWAISLAHAQLTNVLHTMTIGKKDAGIFTLISSFPLYIIVTLCLLIGLEGLSSCLHALRLNWIEFNCRFYKGEGYEFKPLSFEVEEDDD